MQITKEPGYTSADTKRSTLIRRMESYRVDRALGQRRTSAAGIYTPGSFEPDPAESAPGLSRITEIRCTEIIIRQKNMIQRGYTQGWLQGARRVTAGARLGSRSFANRRVRRPKLTPTADTQRSPVKKSNHTPHGDSPWATRWERIVKLNSRAVRLDTGWFTDPPQRAVQTLEKDWVQSAFRALEVSRSMESQCIFRSSQARSRTRAAFTKGRTLDGELFGRKERKCK